MPTSIKDLLEFKDKLSNMADAYFRDPARRLERLDPKKKLKPDRRRACSLIESDGERTVTSATVPGRGPVQIYHLDWTHLRTLSDNERVAYVRSLKIPSTLYDAYVARHLVDLYEETVRSGY